jgi:hypothetical protein
MISIAISLGSLVANVGTTLSGLALTVTASLGL